MEMKEFWGNALFTLPTHSALENAHNVPLWVKVSPLTAGIIGISLAYVFYIRNNELPHKFALKFKLFYEISFNKWYFDEIYDRVFVKPSFTVGRSSGNQGMERSLIGLVQTALRPLLCGSRG